MAANRQQRLKSAEGLLKQGKIPAALRELKSLGEAVGGDLLSLNRIADLLAKSGNQAEAIQYYGVIADRFTDQGFYPKAIAIHKKILRLEKDHPTSLQRLGELYLNQKLHGEARAYLLRAADGYLDQDNRVAARDVFERLAAAEPDFPGHRVRLAEIRAEAGETEAAGEELLRLADDLLSRNEPQEAERAFRRASELLPGQTQPLLGIAACLTASGQEQEALQLLESRAEGGDADPALTVEIALRYEMFGRETDAVAKLRALPANDIPVKNVRKLFHHAVEQSSIDSLWQRLDPVIDQWADNGGLTKVTLLLGELGTLESDGHVPALQRLYERSKSNDDRPAMADSLERLVRAYEKRSMHDEASLMLDQLREIAPKSSLVGQTEAPQQAEPVAPPAPESKPGAEAALPRDEEVPIEAEAPAVPLNRSDEEFVTGRLTQAEILEKYGLRSQALDQIREVTLRFPGHVTACQRQVELLRGASSTGEMNQALVALALARRALGEVEEARRAASEAQAFGLAPETQDLLERLGLVPSPVGEETPEMDPEPLPVAEVAPPVETPAVEVAKPAPAPAGTTAGDATLVIDLDAMDDDDTAEATDAEARPAAVPTAEVPAPVSMDDVKALIDAGSIEKARSDLEQLRDSGHSGPEIDALEMKIANAALEAKAPAAPVQETLEESSLADLGFDDDDDLSTITSALESELFAEEEDAAPTPEAEGVEDVGEMLGQFKQHVDQEVDKDDHRTHYDLGIAYKEMGLIDEAILEFEIAVGSPELLRESSVMLGVCFRDREDHAKAADWYRRALETPGEDTAPHALRYDLADALLKSGDREAALDLFRGLLDADPSFRDVQDRVADLETSAKA